MGYHKQEDGSVSGLVRFDGNGLGALLEAVRTRFVRDRIAETPWSARAHIGDLAFAERVILAEGPHGFAAAIAWNGLERQYPVEVAAIRDELTRGNYMPPEAFHRQERDHTEVEADRGDRARADALRKEISTTEAARAMWRQYGGRP